MSISKFKDEKFDALSPQEMKMELTLKGYELVETAMNMEGFSKISRTLLSPVLWSARMAFDDNVETYKSKTNEELSFVSEVKEKSSSRFFKMKNPVSDLRKPGSSQVIKDYLEKIDRDAQAVMLSGSELEKEKKIVKLIQEDLQKEQVRYDWLIRQRDFKEEYRKPRENKNDMSRLALKRDVLTKEDIMAVAFSQKTLISLAEKTMVTLTEFGVKAPKKQSGPK